MDHGHHGRLSPARLPSPLKLLSVVVISAIAGVVNAIAGGGTLLTFPALVGLGIPPLVANATSTVAIWPGTLGSIWGYRSELSGAGKWAAGFAIPSFLGGALGAWLLLRTPAARFNALVPYLVLGATMLFVIRAPLMRWMRREPRTTDDLELTRHFPPAGVLAAQFCVGVYGGYFGAGIGILMLAVLGFMGLTNIHRMNGLKNWGGLCMNAVAAVMFAFSALVNWPVALSMAVGSVAGGYFGSRGAQRVPQQAVRVAVIVIGLASGIWLFF